MPQKSLTMNWGCVLLTLCFFLGVSHSAFSQLNKTDIQAKREARRDSLKALRDTLNVYYLQNQQLENKGEISRTLKDTTLNDFQMYSPSTRLYHFPSADNTGRIPQPVVFRTDTLNEFRTGLDGYSLYAWHLDNARFYRTKRPFTEINYLLSTAGAPSQAIRGEQIFSILHTQKVTKTLQLGLEMRIISSVGFYLRQWTKHNNFRFFASHISKKGNYILTASFSQNTLKAEENGGLIADVDLGKGGYMIKDVFGNDSIFRTVTQKEAYPINLTKAENKTVNFNAGLFQVIKLGMRSVPGDTAGLLPKLPIVQISNRTHFRHSVYTYREIIEKANYYPNYFDSPDSTNYTFRHRSLSNTLETTFFPFNQKRNLRSISAGLLADLFDVLQQTQSNSYLNLAVMSNLRYGLDSLKTVEASVRYFLSGYNRNNLIINGNFNIGLKDSLNKMFIQTKLGADFSIQSPDFISRNFNSNNYQWFNLLGDIRVLKLYGKVNFNKWRLRLGGEWNNIGNLVYYDVEGSVKQFSGESYVYSAYLAKDLRFAKNFNWDNSITWQGKSNNLIRVPDLLVKSSFYYEGRVFKKALLMRLGFDLFYCTAYQGYRFNPALRQFQLQNTVNTGNYPFIDVYISFKIKRFRTFIKAAHVNQGLPAMNYMLTPGQPMPDRQIQFGISWGLFN